MGVNALLHDPRAVVDAPINYPAPAQLTGSEHFAGLQVVFLPVWLLTRNPVLAINAVLFLAYPLAALAMNRLLAALGASRGVAWVAGLAYALGALHRRRRTSTCCTHAGGLPARGGAGAAPPARSDPTRGARPPFAALLLLAFFSAYYTTTAILLAVLLVRRRRASPSTAGRAPLRAGRGGGRRGALRARDRVASVPSPAARWSRRRATTRFRDGARVSAMSTAHVLLSPVAVFGVTALLLGAAGVSTLRDPRPAAARPPGFALSRPASLLLVGRSAAVVRLLPHGPLADAVQASLSFFRMAVRWTVVSGLGLALARRGRTSRAACVRLSPARDTSLLAVSSHFCSRIAGGCCGSRRSTRRRRSPTTPSVSRAHPRRAARRRRSVARDAGGIARPLACSRRRCWARWRTGSR